MTEENKTTERSGILRILGDIRHGEAAPVFLMLLNLAIILISYYIIKVVREPLILASPGGAAWKSYSAAAQAVVLMGFIPLYGWFSSKVNRMRLVLGVNVFFLICIELFSFAVKANVPYVGVAFFIWVGIFSLSIIAQFWSLANDLYAEDQGNGSFPSLQSEQLWEVQSGRSSLLRFLKQGFLLPAFCIFPQRSCWSAWCSTGFFK